MFKQSKQHIGPFSASSKTYPIVERLKNLIEQNNWEGNFDMAISDARKEGVEEMKHIKTLSDYYNFLNHFVSWVPTEDETGTYVYRMMSTFYFVLDQKSVKPLQTPIVPSYPPPPLTLLSEWMIDFAKAMGDFLNTPESITQDSLKTFQTAQNYNISAYAVPEGGWSSFNEFFARKPLPGTRPIASPSNPAVIVSAADSTFDGFWNINDKSIVILKGLPWSIKELLDDSQYSKDFAGGKFMHSFLAPYDYHRLHAPIGGKVLEAKVIPGQVYLDVTIQEDPNNTEKLILAPRRKIKVKAGSEELLSLDDPGYQFSQARGLVIIENNDVGKVAVLPVGMSQVSSVVLSVSTGDTIKKGDEIGYFQFGGSDIVLVFQSHSNVEILANEHRHYRMGEQIAVAHKK